MKPKTVQALFLAGAVWITAAVSLIAQERSTTSVTPGTTSATTQVERAEVTYVSGNELVVKMDTGEVRHLTVPDSARATVDGKELSIRDLKPGMKLQRTITTTQTPKSVTTVRTVTGKVFAVTAPLHVILSFPDGSPNKQYQVPKDQVFMIDGQKKTVFDLRPGMTVTATAVTESQEVAVSETRTTVGTAPPPPRPATPPPQQVLLIEVPVPVPVPVAAARPAPAPVPARAPEPAPVTLPKTASPVPLLAMVGFFLCVTSLALRATRR
jgi:hypothetical protein